MENIITGLSILLIVCFLIYLIPVFVLHAFFIVQSDKPHPFWSIIVNFLLCSLIIFLIFIFGLISFNIFLYIELGLLVALPLIAIFLLTISPLINYAARTWKKLIHTKAISYLPVLFIYICFALIILVILHKIFFVKIPFMG